MKIYKAHFQFSYKKEPPQEVCIGYFFDKNKAQMIVEKEMKKYPLENQIEDWNISYGVQEIEVEE